VRQLVTGARRTAPLPRVEDVGAHRLLRGIRIAGLDGGEDLLVLLERHVELAVQVEAGTLTSLTEQRVDEVDGESVGGHLAHGRVEDDIGGIEPGFVVDRVAHEDERRTQAFELLGRAAVGGVAR
jgi:hypothetical protein